MCAGSGGSVSRDNVRFLVIGRAVSRDNMRFLVIGRAVWEPPQAREWAPDFTR